MDERVARFVERMGLYTEAEGLPRIAGRIFGFLLVQPAACSLEDLASALGVSKASISTDTRRLEQLGLLERTSRPGDRRDYYIISQHVLPRSLDVRLERMRRFQELLDEARSLPLRSPTVRDRLDNLVAAHTDMIDAVAELQQRWKATSEAELARQARQAG
jgi:DNA-binding transcriptional regulator GbsR (MarR family)